MQEVLANILHSRSRGYNLFLNHTGKLWEVLKTCDLTSSCLHSSRFSEVGTLTRQFRLFFYSLVLNFSICLSAANSYNANMWWLKKMACSQYIHSIDSSVAINTLIFPNLQFLLINTLLAIILIKRRVAARSAEPFVRVSCFSVMNWNRVPLKNYEKKALRENAFIIHVCILNSLKTW